MQNLPAGMPITSLTVWIPQIPRAVSYTHLDVYKRQILNDGGFIIEVIFVGIGDAKMVAKLIACPEPFAADITLDILGAVGIARLGCFTGRAEMIAENVPRFKPLAAVEMCIRDR